jgi:hypothetical protein
VKRVGTAALVLGIVAAFFAVIPAMTIIAVILAVVGVVISIRSLRNPHRHHGRAAGGLVLSVVAFLLALIIAAATSGADDDDAPRAQDSPASASTSEPRETAEPAVETAESTPPAAETPAPAPAADPFAGYPADEVAFIQAVEQSTSEIEAAATDLQRSQAVRNRDPTLCGILGDANADGWVGEVKGIGANQEGKGYIDVVISDTVVVQTWNNAFSDGLDNTLVPTDASFFNSMVALVPGEKVTFSATFLSDTDSCLKGANLTETFYGLNPNFIVRFSNIGA